MSRLKSKRKPFALILVLALALAVSFYFSSPGLSRAASEEAGHETAAGEVHDTGHEAEHGGTSSAKVWDLVFRIMNFTAMAVILFFLLKKPIAQYFGNRREEIARTLEQLERRKEEAEEHYRELERKLGDLESEREAIIEQYIKDGEREKTRIIANAERMSEQIQKQAEAAINQEIQKAKIELKREIAELSATMAEDLIKENITDQDQKRLVEEYLDEVVEN